MAELEKRGWSGVLGGVVGYGFGVFVNPILRARHIPELPEYLTSVVGAFVSDQLTNGLSRYRTKIDAGNRKRKALNALRELESAIEKYEGGRPPIDRQRIAPIAKRVRQTRVECDRDEFDVRTLERAISEIDDAYQRITGEAAIIKP